jgi:outer membrane receptor protein involved in Fe transport
MKSPKAHNCTAIAAAAALVFTSSQVSAQDAPAAAPQAKQQPDQGGQTVQTIEVTAQRRREPAREVPMQLNVISTSELEKSGAKTLTDLLADLPGVDVKTQGGAGLGAISVRGVSTGDQTVSTVGTYIDDVAFGSYSAFVNGPINALEMNLLDLHHVELLRGPQGTLYGAGAMGGLLKYVTTQPNSYELSGKLGLTVSGTKGGALSTTENVVVNAPLKESVAALRIAGFTQHEGGYVDAVGPAAGSNINAGHDRGIRAALGLDPSKNLHLRFSVLAQDLKRGGLDYVDYDPATARPVNQPPSRYLVLREPYASKIRLASVDAEYETPSLRLNSITSVQRVQLNTLLDMSTVYGPLLAAQGLPVSSVSTSVISDLKKVTQEFRLTSNRPGRFEWLAGVFLDHERGTNDQGILSTLPDGTAGPDLIRAQLPTKFDEGAVYGNATWNFDSGLSLTGGVRVAHNRQTYGQIGGGLLAQPTDLTSNSSETSKTYLLTVKYALSRTSNVYARAASGYRPGGPNVVLIDPSTGQLAAPPTFKHDSLWSYEAGYKVDLPSSGWSLQSSVFQINWNDIQQYYAVQGLNLITNAGKARIRGAELSAQYKSHIGLSANASVAYTDAELVEAGPGLGMAGSRLPNSAKFSGSVGAQYAFEAGGLPSVVDLTVHGASARNAGFEGSNSLPNVRLPGYGLVDARLGFTWQKIEFSLFARNVANRRALMSAQTTFVPLGGAASVVESRPRTVGLSMSLELQ